jgi:hypothetical protein
MLLRRKEVKKRMILAFVTSFICGGVSAQSVDLNLSNDTVEGVFSGAVGGTGMGKSRYDISVLFSEEGDDENWMAGGGFTVSGDAGSDAPGLELGVGIKAYIMEVAKYDVSAIPLGGYVRYAPPVMNRFYVLASLFWAPEIVTFYDGEEFKYGQLKFGYELLPTADFYLGYRNIDADIKNRRDEEVAEGWMAGVKLTF